MLPVHGHPETDRHLLSSTGRWEEGVTKGMNKGKTEFRVNCKTWFHLVQSLYFLLFPRFFFFKEQMGALVFRESKFLKYCYYICLTTQSQSCPSSQLWHLWENKIPLWILICLLASQMCVWVKCCLVIWQVPGGHLFQQRHIQKKNYFIKRSLSPYLNL